MKFLFFHKNHKSCSLIYGCEQTSNTEVLKTKSVECNLFSPIPLLKHSYRKSFASELQSMQTQFF